MLHNQLIALSLITLVANRPNSTLYDYSPVPTEDDNFDIGANGCNTDHGERTNRKLSVQPFYVRGRNGKMRNW